MNVMQWLGQFLGERMSRIYGKIQSHVDEETIHRTSGQIRAEIVEGDIPGEIARVEAVETGLAGKVDKAEGRELMPSPGASPRQDCFLNEQGEYIPLAGSYMVLEAWEVSNTDFAVNEDQLRKYVDRVIAGGEPGLAVFFKFRDEHLSQDNYYKVVKMFHEGDKYVLTAVQGFHNLKEINTLREYNYFFLYDETLEYPLTPLTGIYYDSSSYTTAQSDMLLAQKADTATVEAGLALHDTSSTAHADLRNSIANITSGTTAAGNSEYAVRLGNQADSYTKADIDAKLNRRIYHVDYDPATATFRFEYADGAAIEIDTPLEHTVKDGRFDLEANELILVLVSGQEIRIPAAGLNKAYTGKETSTTNTTVNSSGQISVDLKQGVINAVHLSGVLRDEINRHLTVTGDTKENVATFPDQPVRANLVSGERHSVLFGKAKRWFTDLRALAFKDKVAKSDLETALQTEIDGKLPASDIHAWAKAANKPGYNFNEIGDAPQVNVAPGVVCRKTIVCNAKTGQGWTSRIALGLTNPAARYSPALISIGAADLGDTWIDFTFDTNGRIYSPAGEFALVSQIPASLPANGGNADTLGEIGASGFARAYSSWLDFGGDANDISTTDFIDFLKTVDAFKQPYWCARGSWLYGYNKTIADAGVGRIGLAGAVVEVFGTESEYCTIRITTPTTSVSGVTKRVFIYVNNGAEYIPGWFRLADSSEVITAGERSKLGKFEFTDNGKCLADGKELATVDQIPASLPANGGNAATVGGKPASDFVTVAGDQTITGTKVFTKYCDFAGGAGNSGSDMRFKREVAPVGGILPRLMQLNVIGYVWEKEGERERETFGVSASELTAQGGVFARIVHEREDAERTQWVEYDRIGVLALKGVQELVQAVEKENRELRRELAGEKAAFRQAADGLQQELAGLRRQVEELKAINHFKLV